MRASLPMYDLPELEAHTDAWWAGIAAALRRSGIAGVPDRLDRGRPYPLLWSDPDLLLSQTCGYPLVTRLAGTVVPVATPVYAAPGCAGARYSSAILVRADCPASGLADMRGTRCAVNARDSHSGYNALRAAVAPLAAGRPFFAEVIETGAHAVSFERVAAGEADLCALDAVTFALLSRHRPAIAARLRVLGYTASAPGLPYVTRAGVPAGDLARLRDALDAAAADPALAPARAALLIERFERIEPEEYREIAAMEAAAIAAGYPAIA